MADQIVGVHHEFEPVEKRRILADKTLYINGFIQK